MHHASCQACVARAKCVSVDAKTPQISPREFSPCSKAKHLADKAPPDYNYFPVPDIHPMFASLLNRPHFPNFPANVLSTP